MNLQHKQTHTHLKAHMHKTCGHSVSFREVEDETDVTLELGGGLLSSSPQVLKAKRYTNTETDGAAL